MVALANVKLPSFFRTHPFLSKTLSLASTALTTNLRPTRTSIGLERPAKWQMENASFNVHFDLDSGSFTIWRKNETPLCQKAATSVSTLKARRCSSETDYARCVKVSKFNDDSGSGQRLLAQCIDRRHELDLEIRVYIFDQRDEIEVETICKNVSKEDFIILGIEPFQTRAEAPVTARFNSGKPQQVSLIADTTDRPKMLLEIGKTISSRVVLHSD